jgi:hypothetical protein
MRKLPTAAVLACALLGVLGGCLGTPEDGVDPTADAGDGADDEARSGRPGQGSVPDGPASGTAVETTSSYSGRVVLRATGEGDPTYIEEGDSPQFCFGLPTNVTQVRAVFTYSPRQQAGLEFHAEGVYVNSWSDSPADLVPESPITLTIGDPSGGAWFVAGGPGSVGGAMDWSMDLTMVTEGLPSPEAIAYFQSIDPAC